MRPHLILVSWPEKNLSSHFGEIWENISARKTQTENDWFLLVCPSSHCQTMTCVRHAFQRNGESSSAKKHVLRSLRSHSGWEEKSQATLPASSSQARKQRLLLAHPFGSFMCACACVRSNEVAGFDHTVAWVRQLWVWPGKHSLSLSGTHTSAGWPCYSCTACFKKYSHVVVFSWLWANPLSQIIIPVCRRKKCEMHSVLWKSPQALTKNLSFSVILPLWKKRFVSNISQVVINDIGCSQPCLLVLAVPHSSSWSLRFWYFAVHHFPPVSTITTTPNVVVVVHVIGGTSMFSRGQRNWLLTSETTPAWLGSGKGLGEPRRRRLWRATALAKLGRGLSLRLLPLLSWWGHRLLLSPLAVRLRVSFVIKKHS